MKFRLNSLNEWFKELGITIDHEILDKESKTFDGIPVWLIFGNKFVRCVKDLIKITEIAINLAFEEPENLVREREKICHRGIAKGAKSWSKIKDFVEEEEGTTVSNSVLQRVLKNLKDLGIIKDYEFLDPVYKEASKSLPIKAPKE